MPFIPLEVYANNATTTVTSGGTLVTAGTQETWTVTAADAFPVIDFGATQFHVADPAAPSEMVTVLSRAGSTWLVQRGADGTTPVAHTTPFTAVQVVTAGALAELQYPPWQFPVQKYGAQGDGKIGTGGTGTAGSSVLTDTGAAFVNAAAPAGDVGKVIIINQGAGSATSPTNPFCGTITAVNSPTSVTLSGNLAANCSSAPYMFGTDDAAAIRTAVDAAETWAKTTGNYKVQVVFQPGLYMLGSLFQSTSPYHYNTHIRVPFSGQYEQKLAIDFIGTGDAAGPQFWGSAVPNIQGTCLVSAVFPAAQPNGTYGQQSVIGAPSTSDGIGAGGLVPYANVLASIDGITVVTPYNAQQYGFDFRYAAQANIPVGAALAFAPVNFGSQPVGGTWLRSTTLPSNGVAAGLAMPLSGNNDNSYLGTFTVEGYPYGVILSEHLIASRLVTMYCQTGLLISWVPAGGSVHGATILQWSGEGCDIGLDVSGPGSTETYPLFIGLADFEVIETWWIRDAGHNLFGVVNWYSTMAAWSPYTGISGAGNLHVVNCRMPRGPWAANSGISVPAPPAAPSSGTAQQNTTYLPATVYISATSGITGAAAGRSSTGLTALGVTAGNGAVTHIRVPAGHWYSVTYAGTLTTTWVLE